MFLRSVLIQLYRLSIVPLAILVWIIAGCSQEYTGKRMPRATGGVLDLKDWDIEKDGPVDLSGAYEFYWHQHIPPDAFIDQKLSTKKQFIQVPDSWNGYEYEGEKLSGTGHATYRLNIRLSSPHRQLALKFLDMGTAYRVFVNGELISSVGHPGTTAETTSPRYFPQIVNFMPQGEQIELVFHVSNFHHRSGGVWEIIQLGKPVSLYEARERRLYLDFFLFGSILIMAIYHLGLFRFRQEDKSFLFFGIFCLLISVRLLTTVERYFLQIFPDTSWELFVKIEYLSFYLCIPVFAGFIYLLFNQEFSKKILYIILLVSLAFTAIVLVTPVSLFSHTVLACQLFAVACFLYGAYVILLGIIRKREGAWIMLVGYLVLFLAVINDMLDVNEIVRTGHWVHFGVFVFILSQGLILSFRYSRMFEVIEIQHKNLQEEIKVRKKVEADLKKSQQQLKEYSMQLNAALEKERALISREIHDELGQLLAKLNMDIYWLEGQLPAKKELFKKTKSMSDLITLTVEKVRQISQNLRPSVLDNLGFYAAIEWQLSQFEKQSGIQCDLSIEPNTRQPGEAIASSLFRVFQEALTNIFRHASATEVSILLKEKASMFYMEIRDNGRGITGEEVDDAKSFGLTGIRERVRILNGTVKIEGVAGEGTSIKVNIPFMRESKEDAQNLVSDDYT